MNRGIGTPDDGGSSETVLAFLPEGGRVTLHSRRRDQHEEHVLPSTALGDESLAHLCTFLRPVTDLPRLVAANLLDRFGSVSEVLAANAGTLATVDGMNAAAVQLIKNAQQLMLTVYREECFSRKPLPSPAALQVYLRAVLSPETGETIRGLFLDRADGLIGELPLSQERPGSRVPCGRFVARYAVACGASGVILASTDSAETPTPRPAELAGVQQIADTLAAIGVALHDYVLVGRAENLSLREQECF